MLTGKLHERREGFIPAALRLVRIDGSRRHYLTGCVDHGDLHTGAKAGIETHWLTGRCAQQLIAQVGGEHAHRFLFGHVPSRRSTERWTKILVRQAQRTVSMSHWLPGRPRSPNGEAAHDAQFVGAAAGLRSCGAFRLDSKVKNLLLAAERCRNGVRWQLGEGFGKIEVVAKLGSSLVLAIADSRGEASNRPHLLAQRK